MKTLKWLALLALAVSTLQLSAADANRPYIRDPRTGRTYTKAQYDVLVRMAIQRQQAQARQIGEQPGQNGREVPRQSAENGNRRVSPEGMAPARTGPRDGQTPRTGPRDGEGVRSGPRDGQAPRTGPRDGEGVRSGPRDGQAPRTGPRDGQAPRTAPRE